MNTEPDIINTLDKNKFIIIKNFIEPPLLDVIYKYILIRAENNLLTTSDKQVPGAPAMYADPLLEALMHVSLPKIEKFSGKKLFPTYSYSRLYRKNDELLPHIDRPSCEISFSICLGYDSSNLPDHEKCWPIYADNSCDFRRNLPAANANVTLDEGQPLYLLPGDCVVYKGCETKHWRHPFKGIHHAQAFIHYVDQDGPYAKYKYDTRPQLGAAADTIQDNGPYKYFPISFKKKST